LDLSEHLVKAAADDIGVVAAHFTLRQDLTPSSFHKSHVAEIKGKDPELLGLLAFRVLGFAALRWRE